MKKKLCFSLTPAGLLHSRIAIATSKAGGVGVLDLEFCRPEDGERITQNLNTLLGTISMEQEMGLRFRGNQLSFVSSLLSRLSARPYWIMLTGWTAENLNNILTQLPSAHSYQLLLEVTETEQLNQIAALSVPIAGLVLKGSESGGWVGEESAFMLVQKVMTQQYQKQTSPKLPVFVQGGIGVCNAAACYGIGAAGVVLDDQLWLMPESPLPETWQRHLKGLSGQEASLYGEKLGAGCRVLARPSFKGIARLQEWAEKLEIQAADLAQAIPLWQERVSNIMGWGEATDFVWPMGQAVGFAEGLTERYKTTGRLVQALMGQSVEQVKQAQDLQPLQARSPLAQAHRTEYPIVQGPMTRVSDTAEFAAAVAKGGGLPLLALAMMRGKQVEALLRQTQELLGEQSWGVGMLGFVSQTLREEQMEAIRAVKPPFALIAGGRPDQAAHFESLGIPTYIHVPVPRLLKMFLQQGARRFVFEGRECGGHVGPLSSFVLWESMIATLLNEVTSSMAPEVHVLFAGGIHDAYSAAMLGAMTAPLVAKGIRVGMLMGTAYLFTQEAVVGGAIIPEFQAQAIQCHRTVTLESGPGHATRCAVTPFSQEFEETRRRLLAEGKSSEEIRNALEDLNVGRLRIASKGFNRNVEGKIVAVPLEQQRAEGMYMIGQVATLHEQIFTIQDLHEQVCAESNHLLLQQELLQPSSPSGQLTQPSDIAIIGIGTLLPGAQSPEELWSHILEKKNAITEIPAHRWDWRLYYDSDRSARDKIYSKWGGFLDDIPFDPLDYGIPPKSLKSIEPMQLLILETVRKALADAGYEDRDFDRENTSVIVGVSGGSADLGQQYGTRSEIPRFVENPPPEVWDRLPEWTEESFPGLLLNVTAGRIANRFDFGGTNCSVDAACASSLLAMKMAVDELESGRCNVAIAGGLDTTQSPFAYFCFSKTPAMSPTGQSRPFDKNADGIVISEGAGIVVLKRLQDAEADGDRIYAVIKSVGSSSDGKALGLTAPLSSGQRRALQRAYQKADFSPGTIALYEAHGTGTPAGDKAELETINNTLMATGQAQPKSCAIGSVKSLIGHTKGSAGITGLIKASLALYHKVLTPHANVQEPLSLLEEAETPVYLLKEAHPWLPNPDYPRRAGVSAFGFGGTNFHAVLEEYDGGLQESVLGSNPWPQELLVFRAENRTKLISQVQQLQQQLQAGAEPQLRDLAYSYAQRAQSFTAYPIGLAIVTANLGQLQSDLALALDYLNGSETQILPPHILYGENAAPSTQPIAFLFPGQGAQYPEMGREWSLYLSEVQAALAFADQQLASHFPQRLSQLIYPPSAYSEAGERQQQDILRQTNVAQPAIGTLSMGLFHFLGRLGLKPSVLAGHSYGEYTALYGAGVYSASDFLQISAIRGQAMAKAGQEAPGAMAAIQSDRATVEKYLQATQDIVLASHNTPSQVAIAGQTQAVLALVDRLNQEGINARTLPVSGAFHSPYMTQAQAPLAEAINRTEMQLPQIPVYSNVTGDIMPDDIERLRGLLLEHLLDPVEFVKEITTMYEQGVRTFVEVGPRSILSNLSRQILAERDHTIVALDAGGSNLQGLLTGLGNLFVRGIDFNVTSLFQHRPVQSLELNRLVELTRKPDLSRTTWWLNGGSIRKQDEAVGYSGKLPPLTLETAKVNPASVQTTSPTPKPDQPVGTAPVPTVSNISPTNPKFPAFSVHSNPASLPISADNTTISDQASLPLSHYPMNQPNYPDNFPPHHSYNPGQEALMAYQSYQETMRHFLVLQERVMAHFLTGMPAAAPMPGNSWRSMPVSNAAPMIAPQPSPVVNGGHRDGSAPPAHHITVPAGLRPIPAPVETVSTPPPVPPSPPLPVSPPTPAIVSQPTASPATVVATTSNASSTLDRASLTELLLNLVSDRTGYPTDLLKLDQDLEAELGIDSIKRVEILGALQEELSGAIAGQVQQQMERFTSAKSLDNILDQLLALMTEGASSGTEVNGLGKR
jgi:acyl transferase domain-containing protein/NAD(P)H-dependent flavin oxidoreductase YrpB (nitropropane dioxygenase family)/acyl carrier protein